MSLILSYYPLVSFCDIMDTVKMDKANKNATTTTTTTTKRNKRKRSREDMLDGDIDDDGAVPKKAKCID